MELIGVFFNFERWLVVRLWSLRCCNFNFCKYFFILGFCSFVVWESWFKSVNVVVVYGFVSLWFWRVVIFCVRFFGYGYVEGVVLCGLMDVFFDVFWFVFCEFLVMGSLMEFSLIGLLFFFWLGICFLWGLVEGFDEFLVVGI